MNLLDKKKGSLCDVKGSNPVILRMLYKLEFCHTDLDLADTRNEEKISIMFTHSFCYSLMRQKVSIQKEIL